MRITEDFKQFCLYGSEKRGGKKIMITLFFNPCFHSVCLYRFSSLLHKCHLDLLSKVVWALNRFLYHVDIDYRANLGGGFVLIHGLGTVIGHEVVSEGRLIVYQGVTIGGNRGKTRVDSDGKKWGQPFLKDGVTVFANACIFGPVIIRENTVIKAGAIITKDC